MAEARRGIYPQVNGTGLANRQRFETVSFGIHALRLGFASGLQTSHLFQAQAPSAHPYFFKTCRAITIRITSEAPSVINRLR